MKKIPYSELQNWKKQSIEDELSERPVLNEEKMREYQRYFIYGVSRGFDTAIRLLKLHGYIETNFME